MTEAVFMAWSEDRTNRDAVLCVRAAKGIGGL